MEAPEATTVAVVEDEAVGMQSDAVPVAEHESAGTQSSDVPVTEDESVAKPSEAVPAPTSIDVVDVPVYETDAESGAHATQNAVVAEHGAASAKTVSIVTVVPTPASTPAASTTPEAYRGAASSVKPLAWGIALVIASLFYY